MRAARPPSPPADPLAQVVAGTYFDEFGQRHAAPVRALVIEDTLRDREVELVASLELGERLAVVGDDDTFAALGSRVVRALRSRFEVQAISLGRRPHADAETWGRLKTLVEPDVDAIVAVGSGTINDLCKLVAKDLRRPQLVFATAPSMNGYTSVSASLIEGSFKRSIRTSTPIAVYFDLEVLAQAPVRLIRAGLGDSLCRATAQVDWLFSGMLLDTAYSEAPFAMLAADEATLVGAPQALVRGDLGAMRALARTLALSGFGMTMCGGSYPASQGEHLLAHYVDMRGLATRDTFHGEQIGVAAVAMARLQHALMADGIAPQLRRPELTEAELRARYGVNAGAQCWRELQSKLFDDERLDFLNARLRRRWLQMIASLQKHARPPEQLVSALRAVDAPVAPSELGWSRETFGGALVFAREIRDRFTFLDLAADSGFWAKVSPDTYYA